MGKAKSGKSSANSKRAPAAQLLDGDFLSSELQAVLTAIFHRFDVDSDGALNAYEVQSYTRTCNGGEGLDDDELEQMRQYFDKDGDGNLTLRGFFQMYHLQTQARPVDTWNDLKALGYNKALQPVTADAVADSERRASGAEKGSVQPPATALAPAAEAPTMGEVEQVAAKEELRASLVGVQEHPEGPEAHRRVAAALQALGRGDAANRSLRQAEALEASNACETGNPVLVNHTAALKCLLSAS
eukprot:CAMPEP_0183341156 /NCGR_PEP_ID=MMETSP0164_2-20130417/7447_1 /TAXON_ID=221442 /ORGANISM="Coccolithus pelagicus ssp braarudi, Strain PLY182g" /LENGTH=242 /DNA_ID=CAMNT_0025511391 /DNA_START=193 /DNA_END=921 /DNA_ORIENTATION=-